MGKPDKPPLPNPYKKIALLVQDIYAKPIPGALVSIQEVGTSYRLDGITDNYGWFRFDTVKRSLITANVIVEHESYIKFEFVFTPIPLTGWSNIIELKKIEYPKRLGITYGIGRVYTDDNGLYHPLAASLFWALWGWKFDRVRTESNIKFLADHKFDGIRIFCNVSGLSWEDRTIDPDWPDYMEQLIDLTNTCYDKYGIRIIPTYIATNTKVQQTIDKVNAALTGIEHKVIYREAVNEYYMNLNNDVNLLIDIGKQIKGKNLSALSSCPPGTDVNPSETMRDQAGCNSLVFHLDRDEGDDDWRFVRQPYDLKHLHGPTSQNEPKGIQSSVSECHDPLRLVMNRAIGILCGAGAYVLHTGAGVRGGGYADVARGRYANLYDIPNIHYIMSRLRGIDSILPKDLEHWTVVNNGYSGHPLKADAFWAAGDDHGLSRNYAAYSNNRFVVMPHGVLHYVVFTSQVKCNVKFYNPLTLNVEYQDTLEIGQNYRVDDRSLAYIVIGETL